MRRASHVINDTSMLIVLSHYTGFYGTRSCVLLLLAWLSPWYCHWLRCLLTCRVVVLQMASCKMPMSSCRRTLVAHVASSTSCVQWPKRSPLVSIATVNYKHLAPGSPPRPWVTSVPGAFWNKSPRLELCRFLDKKSCYRTENVML